MHYSRDVGFRMSGSRWCIYFLSTDKVCDNYKAKECAQTELKGLESIAPLVRSVEETPDPISTEVHGHIPSWITGNLLRNGPGKFEFGNTQ